MVATPQHAVLNTVMRLGGRDLRMGPTPAPRRFSSGFAAVMFTALGAAFALDASNVVVLAIGVPMLISPSVIVLTNWCLSASIYRQLSLIGGRRDSDGDSAQHGIA